MFRVTATPSAAGGKGWPIGSKPVVIGRGNECDVRIPDPAVSRRHWEITLSDGVMHLRDLGSRNRVLVNGRSVTRCRLELGDELRIGGAVFFITKASLFRYLAENAKTDCIPWTSHHSGNERMYSRWTI